MWSPHLLPPGGGGGGYPPPPPSNDKKKKNKKDKKEKKKDKPPPPPPSGGPPDGDDSEMSISDESSSDDEPTKPSNAGKEADNVTFAALPTQAQSTRWIGNNRMTVIAASGIPKKAKVWIMAVEDLTVTESQLSRVSFRAKGHDFLNLDIKICAGAFRIATGLLGMELERRNLEYKKRGEIMPGRIALRILYSDYELDEERGTYTDIMDLSKVALLNGDSGIALFFATWNSVKAQLKEELSDASLKAIFYDKVKDLPLLKIDMNRYDRMQKSDPDFNRVRSYSFLWDCVRNVIDKAHRKSQSDSLEAARKGAAATKAPLGANVGHERKPKALRKIEAKEKKDADRKKKEAASGAQAAIQYDSANAAVVSDKKSKPWFAFQKGTCKAGQKCEYSHDPKICVKKGMTPPASPRPSSPSGSIGSQKSSNPCYDFQKGTCTRGDKCKFSHIAGAAVAAAVALPKAKALRPDSKSSFASSFRESSNKLFQHACCLFSPTYHMACVAASSALKVATSHRTMKRVSIGSASTVLHVVMFMVVGMTRNNIDR